jgi:malonyl-CoA O-methyltransferase
MSLNPSSSSAMPDSHPGMVRIDKAAARRAFERAAEDYDAAAVLQREIGRRMLDRLEYIRIEPRTVLDLGCGTGLVLDHLSRRWRRRPRVIALDFAVAMLRQARRRGHWRNRPRPLCADMERLPLADDSVDLIFSNATLQWANDLGGTFAELHRVLRPGGLLMFTTFGPDTLMELRSAWAAADGDAHVSPFLDMHDVGDALVRGRFADAVMDVERINLTYPDVFRLMRDLKAIGAHNVLSARSRGLTGRRRLRAMEQAYEQHRRDGRLPSTWEIVHGHAWVGSKALTQRAGSGEVTVPVSAIRRQPPLAAAAKG